MACFHPVPDMMPVTSMVQEKYQSKFMENTGRLRGPRGLTCLPTYSNSSTTLCVGEYMCGTQTRSFHSDGSDFLRRSPVLRYNT